jgi:hypothetical protein
VDETSFRRTVTFLAPLLALPVASIALISGLVKQKPDVAWLRFIGEASPWTVLLLGLGVFVFELRVVRARNVTEQRRWSAISAEFSGRRLSLKQRKALEAEKQPAPGRASAWAAAAIVIAMTTLLIGDPALRGAIDLVLVVAYMWTFAVADRRRRRALQKLCPDCAERVKVGARVCRYCGFRFNAASSPGSQLRPDAARLLSVSPSALGTHGQVVDEFRAQGHTSLANWLAACNGVVDLRAFHAMLVRIIPTASNPDEMARLARVVARLIVVYEDGDIRNYRALAEERRVPKSTPCGTHSDLASWMRARRAAKREREAAGQAAAADNGEPVTVDGTASAQTDPPREPA